MKGDIKPLQQENILLKKCLQDIISSWDKSMRGAVEEKQFDKFFGIEYWIPSGSIVESEYISAARQLLKKDDKTKVIKKNKITINDIEFNRVDVWCRKVTKGTDNQLNKLQNILEDLNQVESVNIEELGFLSISWRESKDSYSNNAKIIICNVINKIFN